MRLVVFCHWGSVCGSAMVWSMGGGVRVCPKCGVVAVWVPGQQAGLSRCTCECHRVVK